jgi:hypothetical protein
MVGFEFVNVTDPKEVKKHSTKIRRHVMKDIGKARQRPKASSSHETVDIEQPDLMDNMEHTTNVVEPGNIGMTSENLARALANPRTDSQISAMVYPAHMNEERRSLVRYSRFPCL